jgi:regulator of protease activity HflC (stomatin/prohibitin superfamily)
MAAPKQPPSPEEIIRAFFNLAKARTPPTLHKSAGRVVQGTRSIRRRSAEEGVALPPKPEKASMLPKIIIAIVLSVIVYVVEFTRPFAVPFLVIALAVVFVIEGVRIVPQQEAWVVERLGRFHEVLEPGLRIIIPIVDRVAYKHSLKEVPFDVPEQVCITKDNTQLAVDGIVYYQVTDPRLASYGTSDYLMAITQLAQTTLRSEVGKMELDKTLESRDEINRQIVAVLDEAGRSWGVKVLRYEVKNLTPPEIILRAMQQQITAEREKRALIAKSEGQKQEEINIAEGSRQAAILKSEGDKQAAINQAQGEATAIRVVAEANAAAIRVVAEALGGAGGMDAANLKVAEEYVSAFSNVAKAANTLILPSNLSDVAGLVASAMTVVDRTRHGAVPPPAPRA